MKTLVSFPKGDNSLSVVHVVLSTVVLLHDSMRCGSYCFPTSEDKETESARGKGFAHGQMSLHMISVPVLAQFLSHRV